MTPIQTAAHAELVGAMAAFNYFNKAIPVTAPDKVMDKAVELASMALDAVVAIRPISSESIAAKLAFADTLIEWSVATDDINDQCKFELARLAGDKPAPRVMLCVPGEPDVEVTDKRVLDSLPNWAKGLAD